MTAFAGSCRSIVGKDFTQSYWVGICDAGGGLATLRSYLKGGSSLRDGGTVRGNRHTHIAVTYDGSERRHYINGELAATFSETGPLPASGSPLRFGSDIQFPSTPKGNIDEARL